MERMKKWFSKWALALLATLMVLTGLVGCSSKDSKEVETALDVAIEVIDEDGHYTSKEDVALYLHTYGKLPSNFITKKEAENLGWKKKDCDINYAKGNRGAERLVYSNDGLIFYTGDHYESFEQLYP